MYQPVGSYLTTSNAASTYQPLGSYLTTSTASSSYQPIGSYPTNEELTTILTDYITEGLLYYLTI